MWMSITRLARAGKCPVVSLPRLRPDWGAGFPAEITSFARDLPPPRTLAAAMIPRPMLELSTARRVRLAIMLGSISIFLLTVVPPTVGGLSDSETRGVTLERREPGFLSLAPFQRRASRRTLFLSR